jgi:hypothetical protein
MPWAVLYSRYAAKADDLLDCSVLRDNEALGCAVSLQGQSPLPERVAITPLTFPDEPAMPALPAAAVRSHWGHPPDLSEQYHFRRSGRQSI